MAVNVKNISELTESSEISSTDLVVVETSEGTRKVEYANIKSDIGDGKVDKVTGKGLSTNDYTDSEKTKLQGIETGAQVNTVTGVKGDSESTYRTGNINITKTNIGLGNVDNTADANKSVASATKAAQDESGNNIKSSYASSISINDHTITLKNKNDTSLGTVTVPDNDTHYDSSTVVGASGTAKTNAASGNGATYVNHIENGNVRSSHLVKGKGATTVTSDANGVITINSTDNNTTYGEATTDTAGLMSSTDKTKLNGIETGAQVNTVTGVKGDSETSYRTGNVNITKSNIGLGNVENKSSATIRGELTKSNVTTALGYTPPTTDTNTTYGEATTSTAGLMSASDKTKLNGIATGATANTGTITAITMNGSSMGTSGTVNLGTVLTAHQDISGKYDKTGGTISGAVTITGNLTLKGSGNYGNAINLGDGDYVHISEPTDDCMEIKAKKINFVLSDTSTSQFTINGSVPSFNSGGVTGVKGDSESSYRTGNVNITAANVGAAASSHTHSEATTSAAGFMSASDKTKLNGIATGAQVNTVTGVKGDSESSYRTGNINITAANVGAAASSHTHTYAGSSSAGGAATSANKVNSALTINKHSSASDTTTTAITYDGSSSCSIYLTSPGILNMASSNAGHANSIFRGAALSVTTNHLNTISAGTFRNMYIGDYFLINNIYWRIAAFDYWYGKGNSAMTTHHIVLVPDTCLTTAAMNTTDTTSGGYVGSAMYKTNLSIAKTTINNAFGVARILSHKEILDNAVTSGAASGWTWVDSTVELMNENMLYGHNSKGETYYSGGIDLGQLPLFKLAPQYMIANSTYWLRTVASASQFAAMSTYGNCFMANASTSTYGVRPVFAFGVSS